MKRVDLIKTIEGFGCQADLPDDTEVIVTTGPATADDDGQVSPEEITRMLAAMDAIEPFELTDGKRAVIQADRQARKEWEKTHFEEHAEKLRRIWE